MALTEKGQFALKSICTYFRNEPFTAVNLSNAAGEKIHAASLTALVNHGYLERLGGSPVQYQLIEGIDDVLNTQISSRATNTALRRAAKTKDDEFYTLYSDIETEVMHYRKQFKNKIVYLPCDDPAEKKSKFWDFFVNNFDAFQLKKLIATHYDINGTAYKIWIDEDTTNDGYIDDADAKQENLSGNGDFRSPECVEILQQCDIVCTNPPFSLFRDFVDLILDNNKQFLIIGNKNAYGYKEIFQYIQENKLWTGYTSPKQFIVPVNDTTRKNITIQQDGTAIAHFGNIAWFTNLKTSKRDEPLILTKTYNPIDYPKYDNYNAIDVGFVKNIPKDYSGIMGVPITFIDKYCPQQFKILGIMNTGEENPGIRYPNTPHGRPVINGEEIYIRMLIQKI